MIAFSMSGKTRRAYCKDCASIMRKTWYEANKEKAKLADKLSKLKNAKYVKSYDKAYREAHKKEKAEYMSTYNKKYYIDNQVKISETNRKYRDENQVHIVNYKKEYAKNNPEKISAASSKRRAKKNHVNENFTHAQRLNVKKAFNHKCYKCGSGLNLEIDHHLSLSSGYPLTDNNAVLLCKTCNLSKFNKHPSDFYSPNEYLNITNYLKTLVPFLQQEVVLLD